MNILKEKLLKLIKERPHNYGQCCCDKNHQDLMKEVFDATRIMDESFSFKTRIFWILNDISDFPRCCICGKEIKRDITTMETGYNKYRKWKKEDLNDITCNDMECISKNKIKHIENTNIKKYGVKCVFENEEIRKRIFDTNIRKYGCGIAGNRKEGREKAKKTLIRKYGTQNPLKSNYIRRKKIETCLRKYGVYHYTKTEEYRLRTKRRNLEELLKKVMCDKEVEFKNPNELEKIKDVHEFFRTQFDFICKCCGNVFRGRPNVNNYYRNGTISSCRKCHSISKTTSNAEKEIVDFIRKNYNGEIIENDYVSISPLELDIFLKDMNIAFEYDGLYWHSETSGKCRDYHVNKTEMCEKNGIRLIHIFENEWKYKNDIVKYRILNILGKYNKTVFGRKCNIKEVDSKTMNNFLDENHLQGRCQSRINLGLFCDEDLVSVMTFGKPRFNNKYEWELLRFCNKLGYHVIGGAGKLLKYFERNYDPKSLISYADRRWSKGDLYLKLGFELIGVTKPNYYYFKHSYDILENRLKYQKHKQKEILEKFDETKSEYQNMLDNGFLRIFDCGNILAVKKYDKCV